MTRLLGAAGVAAVAGAILASVVVAQGPENAGRPVFTRLVVKLRSAPQEAGETAAAVLAELKARLPGATTWSGAGTPLGGGVFELRPLVTESGGRAALTAAQAWDAANALRGDPRVEYAEPAFAVPGAPGETSQLDDCRPVVPVPESAGDDTPLPGAVADSEWSLGPAGANVLDAWKMFPPGKTPGDGVWIGHPDTGYRQHPEIWSTDRHVHPELGWDFVDNDNEPLDAFTTGGLRNPGHGTRTASVIISPRGRQLDGDSPRVVSGVASGARLIPLRVANAVVLFDTANLASAIRAAVGDDRNLVKQKVDVISISLGGPPSRVLHDAVSFAERRGVLVLAAAGNQVKKVVWPARYPQVIALAASNVESRPWAGSSRGSAVAITAPGESIWVASPRPPSPEALNCLQMGSGTSYAVATTAGVAAMWVSLHKGEPTFDGLRAAGQQTDAFRRILRSTARTVTGWDASAYGPGILNALKVLQSPVPAAQESEATQEDRCSQDLDALESLFDEAPLPRRRLARLFGRDACEAAMVADEVAFLYATDARVSEGLDAISGAAEPSNRAISQARSVLRASGSRQLRSRVPR